MSDGTMTISHVLDNIKSCLESNDFEAADFLRDGLIETVSCEQTLVVRGRGGIPCILLRVERYPS